PDKRRRRRAAEPLPPLKAPGTAHLALSSRPWELMAASVQPCHIHGLNAGTVYHIARWSQCKLPKKLQSLKIDHRRAKKICRINAVQKVWHADPTPYSQICPIKYGRFPTQSDRNFPHKTVTRSSERL
ncbi:MAG: hypothetical protein VZQ78_11070, partial [Prevotella sp.]|nr:hypothetical protein [Prevotella sp.]